MSGRIIQIIPADGWHAKFRQDDGSLEISRIICFALVEYQRQGGPEQEIHGMESDVGGTVFEADKATNFVGYIHESDPEFRRSLKADI